MAFEKLYVGPGEEWQPIDTDQLHEDLEGYYKDPTAAGIELIAATPQAVIRTPWAIYRFMDDTDTPPFGLNDHMNAALDRLFEEDPE